MGNFKNTGLKAGDVGLVLMLLLVLGGLYWQLHLGDTGVPRQLLVIDQSGERAKISLNRDAEYEFRGAIGRTVIEVRSGAARVKSAPCPLRICYNQGAIRAVGETVICIPNRIKFSIVVAGEPSYQELSY